MIATLKNTRDQHSQNPISVMEVDGATYTFPGADRIDRADALLDPLTYQKSCDELTSN